MPPKIKICGLTNRDDAIMAVEAGADFLGFIFYPPSKRAISSSLAKEMVSELRTLEKCPLLVGVFVNEPAGVTASVLDECGLDLAQLSGSEPASFIGDPASPLFARSYKALKPTSLAEAEAEAEWFIPAQRRSGQPDLLIDAYHPKLPGGTGLTVDWSMASELAGSVPRLMLAGGLTPENVAKAVRQVKPFAVDVASGVESAPGRKDPALVRAFVSAVRKAT